MVIIENLILALQSLRANPLRSILTLIGIAVGIGAVLYVVALGEITQRNINERLEAMGSNVLSIRPGYSHRGNSCLQLRLWPLPTSRQCFRTRLEYIYRLYEFPRRRR